MSSVRRFFCLFVTFDLLFTSLMWLICVMMRGETLEQIFDKEIIKYNIKSSLFDIVVVALSTSCTCAFLIAKVFVYDWLNASQPVYQVFLILTSFTLSWGEAWFLDFRVLPQEQVLDSILQHGVSERSPLLAPQAAGPQSAYAESTVKWFSPVETPESSPRPRRPGEQIILTQEQVPPNIDTEQAEKELEELSKVNGHEEYESKMSKVSSTLTQWMRFIFNRDNSKEEFNPTWLSIDEYKAQADESMVNAWRIVNLPNWHVEKRGVQKGDVVESRRTELFGKVYRFTGVVECPPKFLYEEFKNNITKLPEWNPTILKSELIKEISDGIDLTYQVTAGGGRGIIAPRDFVNLRRSAQLASDGRLVERDPDAYISSGVSVQVPGYPPHRDMVRGHNKVGCWYLQPRNVQTAGGKIETHTTFQWLMCCDLKGKIPQFVLDAAFSTVMLDYIVHVRKFVAEAKEQGRF
ncbi:hypothetical protein O3G_MSEX011203 [Manduca sexta]|nr:hypothetical protein O3G_MSEX011203 [Manduca sexta]